VRGNSLFHSGIAGYADACTYRILQRSARGKDALLALGNVLGVT